MKMLSIGLLGLAALVSASAAAAAPTVTVTPYLADNAFGSPSYAQQIQNQFTALDTGVSSAGTPGSPTYYQAQSNITKSDLIVTNFASYEGSADPAATYGSAYANELGTRGAFGVEVNGNGTQFSISQLSFAAVDNSSGHYLSFANAAGSYNYGNGYVGIDKGADGILFTADDVFVTSGSNTQTVDALIGRGSGTAFSVTCGGGAGDFGPCGDTATNQSYIDAAVAGYPFPTQYTGTYSLGGATGSGTFTVSDPTVSAAPEPGTWVLMLGGVGMLGAFLRMQQARRREYEVKDIATA